MKIDKKKYKLVRKDRSAVSEKEFMQNVYSRLNEYLPDIVSSPTRPMTSLEGYIEYMKYVNKAGVYYESK